MRQILLLALLVLVGGAIIARQAERMTPSPARAPARVAAAADPNGTPSPAAPTNSRSVAIRGGAGGHFQVEARVDGRRLDFVVDTGATHIALRESDAARLGIHPVPRDYSVKVSTANGLSLAAPVELRMVEVGNIIVRDLRALVHPDEALGVNLLGMSFLSRVRWTHERGQLILEQ